jgi:DNA repair protein RadD
VVVFCTSLKQAEDLSGMVPNSEWVSGETSDKERARIINGFKDGSIKTVFNVGVLTTGFDHPALDCIVLLRPTRSIALYYQMLGRGVRIAPGKTVCRVIDLTSTIKNLGKIETIKLISGKETESGKYELISETGSWHNRQLYEWVEPMNKFKKKKKGFLDFSPYD